MSQKDDAALVETLSRFDTPTICNALEIVVPERRGHGYTTRPLVCTRPALAPVVGFARTATIRASTPSEIKGQEARALSDAYYAYIDEGGAKPSVVVIEDIDPEPGYGSFWGEVNSNIHLGFGCRAVITNGSVRDIPDIASGFQMLADRIGPSHAYVHVVQFGCGVNVAGMDVTDGDLVHADQHGAVVVPKEVVADIPAAVEQVVKRERVIIEAAKERGFDIARLRQAMGEAAEIH